MNARILQGVVLATVALSLSLGWLLLCWPQSPALALAGAALGLAWPGLQLGLQMLMMRRVARATGALVPAWSVLAAAWAAEWKLALQVFGWRLPFRADAEADGVPERGRVGVVLVHGFFCNRAVWAPWLRGLKARGIACTAVTLEPAHGAAMDAMVPDLDACVRRMAQATGRAPLIVAHSMGGLVVRAWLRDLDGAQRRRLAAHVVTLATPHGGTWMARFAHGLPARDMRPQGDWLRRLGPPPGDVPFSCWWSACDNIVFPGTLATLPGREAHGLDDVAHVQLVFDERVWQHCLQLHARLDAAAPDAYTAMGVSPGSSASAATVG
ncbi:MAG: alpha/beta fold hydrolase [Burkholderiaceae bacterium]|nr:alpha/beta fold hydrolase [Burkholderiaceae bacterium]